MCNEDRVLLLFGLCAFASPEPHVFGVRDGIRRSGVDGCALSWPNDVELDGKKAAGILCERSMDRFVAGIGVNVTAVPEGRFDRPAASLADHSEGPDRFQVLAEILLGMETWWARLVAGETSRVIEAYRDACVTIKKPVRVRRGAEEPWESGWAADVVSRGSLVVRTEAGCVTCTSHDSVRQGS